MIHRGPTIPDDTNPAAKRRRYGRIRQRLFRCNLGEVLDLSPAGMRVRCRIKPSPFAPFRIKFKGFDLPGHLMGRQTWSRRVGFFRHEFGVEFIDATPQMVNRLKTIAGCGGTPRLTAQSMPTAA